MHMSFRVQDAVIMRTCFTDYLYIFPDKFYLNRLCGKKLITRIINTVIYNYRIKTQRISYMPEPVGSPAVRVQNSGK